MDVVWGETAGVDGQLWLLCPILFILQVIHSASYISQRGKRKEKKKKKKLPLTAFNIYRWNGQIFTINGDAFT